MTWHPNQISILITGSIDNSTKIWDVFYGTCLSTLNYGSVAN